MESSCLRMEEPCTLAEAVARSFQLMLSPISLWIRSKLIGVDLLKWRSRLMDEISMLLTRHPIS